MRGFYMKWLGSLSKGRRSLCINARQDPLVIISTMPGDGMILVTGATGYVGGRLVPRLLEAGHRVRCLARDPRRLEGRSWQTRVEVVAADAMDPSSLAQALRGVDAAYYLMHGMQGGRSNAEHDLQMAHNFANYLR